MTDKKPRIVVTGLGIVASNAHGTKEFTEALQEGKSGIRYLKHLEELNFSCKIGGIPQGVLEKKDQYFSPQEHSSMNEAMTYGGISALDAFNDAGLKIPVHDGDFVDEDAGAIIGTGIGGMDTITDKIYPQVTAGNVKRLGSAIVEQVMASAVSARLVNILALGNQVTTNSSACSTGCEAIIMGTERIRAGLAKRMLVGGAEGTSPYTWSGFDSLRVLNRKFNDCPEEASRPMSGSAAGFVASGGAGVLVIEEMETALARGAKIYAEIIGTSINCGGQRHGGSMTAPSSRGVQRCIRTAILQAQIRPEEIDYINGHLTATFADPLEINNWAMALELSPQKFPYVNSTKSLIGHSLGAAGAIESVATVLQIHRGFVHGSLNCEDLHPEILPYQNSIVHRSFTTELNIAAKASFGFGDVNSCIIFKKWRR